MRYSIFLSLLFTFTFNSKADSNSTIKELANVNFTASNVTTIGTDEYNISSTTDDELEFVTEQSGHAFSVLRFSYSEDSPLGPRAWDNVSLVKDAVFERILYTKNRCDEQWTTPLNIETKNVIAPDDTVEDSDSGFVVYKSLTLIPQEGIQFVEWKLGHPGDGYHGLEIRPPRMGLFQLNDAFDHISDNFDDEDDSSVDEFTNFDFFHASLFYCDPSSAPNHRSNHQINGVKFPLEIDFIFLNQPPKIGIERYLCPEPKCKAVAVMLSVLAEFAESDNPKLEPLVKAAAKYHGPDFSSDNEDEASTVVIQGPWSPSWLIPKFSDYYYYDGGSFPVPPCFFVTRVYVVKERITISKRQFQLLSSVSSEREPEGKMPCTYSVLQETRGGGGGDVIKYNEWPYVLKGRDGRGMTAKERERRDKYKALRKRNKLEDEEDEVGDDTAAGFRSYKCSSLLLCLMLLIVVVFF